MKHNFSPKPIKDDDKIKYYDFDDIDIRIQSHYDFVTPIMQFIIFFTLLLVFFWVGYESGQESVHNLAIQAKVGDFIHHNGKKVFIFIQNPKN